MLTRRDIDVVIGLVRREARRRERRYSRPNVVAVRRAVLARGGGDAAMAAIRALDRIERQLIEMRDGADGESDDVRGTDALAR